MNSLSERYSETAPSHTFADLRSMPHIDLPHELGPGISGLFAYRPDTARILRELAETLLRGPSSLTPGEREIIAASVSWWNDCHFCHSSHAAAACAHLGRGPEFMDAIKAGLPDEPLSPKMRALLAIARRTQEGGKQVTEAHIAEAHSAGATDREIHDTVLIAASFCMYNRYVDGLATWAPAEKEAYLPMGERMAHQGYVPPASPRDAAK
jgi:uncharacterized peroxidase-related enzyme